jgi:hypothetical protein
MFLDIPNPRTPKMSESVYKYCVSWTDNDGDHTINTDFGPTVWTVAKALSDTGLSVTIDRIDE